MELIETEEEKSQGVLPEPEPRYRPVVQQTEHGQTWLRLAIAIIVGIILVVLIVLLARWAYHKIHHNAVTTPTVSTSSPSESSNSTPQTSKTPASSSNNSSNASTPSNSSSTPTTANPNNKLTNTGPGDVVAIFVGASLVAGGLHYIINVRRFAKNT